MKRKILIVSIIAIIISLFSVSYTFAANNLKDGIRNVVGSAENVVENAGSAVGRAVQSGVNTIGNGAKNIGNAVGNTMDNVGNATENTVGAVTNNGDDNGYTATRTTGIGANDMGTSTTMYTWVIIAVTAVGIVVLLWSYFRQNNRNNLYIDSDDQ